MEVLGKRMKKYFRFCCSAPWVQELRRKCPCGSMGHLQLTVTRCVNGRKRFTGKRAALLNEVGGLSPCVGEWPYSGMVPVIQQLDKRSAFHE